MIDLKPYIGRGFPGNIDRDIAEVPVKGIDRQQTQGMVRLCPETRDALYGPGKAPSEAYSPTGVRYRAGSRPRLEAIAKSLAPAGASPRQKIRAAIQWVTSTVVHPHLLRNLAPDRGLSEEALIDSGIGWCNEQSRVFIALCEVMGLPARLCFLVHDNLRCGHTATEVFFDGRWAFVDVTFDVMVDLPDGRPATGLELSITHRALAHAAYRPKLEAYFAKVQPYVESCPGWRSADRPKPEAGGELLGHLGICNYIVEGVEAV
ncbi:MAG: transglutaminase-like domain-containing protein [Planctomycetota bacterium]|nr:transglutaminase-like domain-containing protein [Planctomycetota bacterium]